MIESACIQHSQKSRLCVFFSLVHKTSLFYFIYAQEYTCDGSTSLRFLLLKLTTERAHVWCSSSCSPYVKYTILHIIEMKSRSSHVCLVLFSRHQKQGLCIHFKSSMPARDVSAFLPHFLKSSSLGSVLPIYKMITSVAISLSLTLLQILKNGYSTPT